MNSFLSIPGTKIEFQNGLVDNGSPKLGSKMNNFKVMKQVEELRTSVEKCEDRSKVFNQMPLETQNFLRDWLVNSTDIPVSYIFMLHAKNKHGFM